MKTDNRTQKPGPQPLHQPGEPSGLIWRIPIGTRPNDLGRQRSLMEHIYVIPTRNWQRQVLKSFNPSGHPVACQTLNTTQQFAIEDVADDAPSFDLPFRPVFHR